MSGAQPGPIVIAGAGIAGLTAALAFAARGIATQIHERAPAPESAGAGIQLSPNATRILARLGVLDGLAPAATSPEAIVLRRGRDLKTLARLPLGAPAEARWGAPYLVVHRADLVAALIEAVHQNALTSLVPDSTVRDVACEAPVAKARIETAGTRQEISAPLVVAADGVWSRLRRATGGASRHSGHVAWRAIAPPRGTGNAPGEAIVFAGTVTTFLDPRFHIVAYPLRSGDAINLVAVTKATAASETWTGTADSAPLRRALERAAPALAGLVESAGAWTAWPVHEVAADAPWTRGGNLALVGDAAHALTPFAAQGAAMAIEDAAVLAELVAQRSGDIGGALARYEAVRRPRVARVRRRGAFNKFVWNAAGPLALGRDAVLGLRAPERLMADFDWLYGHDAEAAVQDGSVQDL